MRENRKYIIPPMYSLCKIEINTQPISKLLCFYLGPIHPIKNLGNYAPEEIAAVFSSRYLMLLMLANKTIEKSLIYPTEIEQCTTETVVFPWECSKDLEYVSRYERTILGAEVCPTLPEALQIILAPYLTSKHEYQRKTVRSIFERYQLLEDN